MDKKTEQRIKDFVKYKKFYDVQKKITNRIAHCNACRREIARQEERAIINPEVVTQRFMLCMDCLTLYFKEINRNRVKHLKYDDKTYNQMMEKYNHLLREEFTLSKFYVDGFANTVFVKFGNAGPILYEDTTVTDTPLGHDLEAVLLAVLNLRPKSECIIYSNSKGMVAMLNLPYVRKSRKNEELIAFVKAVIDKKELDIVFEFIST